MAENTAYMSQYLSNGQKETLSLKNFYDTLLVANEDKTDFFRVPFEDFFLKHRKELEDIVVLYTLAEAYFYKPKMVSLELYGTTELWLSILRINKMRNISEFHMPLIYIYDPNQIRNYINIFFKREKIIT